MNDEWLKPALLGVERPAGLVAPGELGGLLAHLAKEEGDAALAFARGAGAVAACSLAAVQAGAVAQAPAPAADDPGALDAGHPWVRTLASVFAGGTLTQGYELRIRHEACTCLAHAGATLPFVLLPRALEAGARSQALRPALLEVLGRRGRWLAERNPDWKFAAPAVSAGAGVGTGQRVWQEGGHADRIAYFRRLRESDPDAARALLQAGLGELGARERAEFVAAIGINLMAADEALLDPLLKDRSREVRSCAAELLAKLAGSAHARRLLGWIEPLVTMKKGLLGKSWECQAPQAADPAWAAAAIVVKRPQHETLGDRAWWLYQLVRQVPLSWWSGRTGMSPPQLLSWAGRTDWTDALLRGWRERASAAEPEWIEAMLGVNAPQLRPHAAELLALLPAVRREKHWPDTIAELGKQGLLGDVTGAFALGETLSPEYSRRIAAGLRECFGDDRLRHDYGLRSHVLELAALVHPASLDAIGPPARRQDETPAMAECAQEFERIVQIRGTLHSHPLNTTPEPR